MKDDRLECLIIGYGSAGKRHKRLAEEVGLRVFTCDNVVDDVHYDDARYALADRKWECCVIATPPDVHLQQIEWAIEQEVPVLCEKPLCGLGQYKDAVKLSSKMPVMVAYNWMWHNAVREARNEVYSVMQRQIDSGREVSMHIALDALQHRILPPWGLLLDHVSHDLSIMDEVGNGITDIEKAYFTSSDKWVGWDVYGKTERASFRITERVYNADVARRAVVTVSSMGEDKREYELDADNGMYQQMWRDFWGCKYEGSWQRALRVQRWLEECDKIPKEATYG